MIKNTILQGDVIDIIKTLLAESVNCIITSPPYFWLRNYDLPATNWPEMAYAPMAGLPTITIPAMSCCLGLEDSIEAYIGHMVLVWRGLWRVLRDDGVLWLNIGDKCANDNKAGEDSGNKNYTSIKGGYNSIRKNSPKTGLPLKNLCGIPWRMALALQADGWYLRSDIIWHKLNQMPESVQDRPTRAHEYIFLLTKKPRYWYDQDAIREPAINSSGGNFGPTDPSGTMRKDTGRPRGDYSQGRNRRTVWAAPEERDPLFSYLLSRLAYDDPERLKVYLDQYTDDAGKRSDVWSIATKPYKGAHFACFPPKLIEPCILAGCPSRVCMECGEPWVRIVEKETKFQGGSGKAGRTADEVNKNGKWAGKQYGKNIKLGPVVITRTIDFIPACDCNAPHCPGVVLDPFFGSGTTAQVAILTGRDWSGIELNPEYIELAKDRIYKTQPVLFSTIG